MFRGLMKLIRRGAIDALFGLMAVGMGIVAGALAGGIFWLWTFWIVSLAALGISSRTDHPINMDEVVQAYAVWTVGIGVSLGVFITVGHFIRTASSQTAN